MPEYSVNLKLFFVPRDLDDLDDIEDYNNDPNRTHEDRQNSFIHTANNIGNIMDYININNRPSDMATEFSSLFDIVPGSEHWTHNDGLSLCFNITTENNVTLDEISGLLLANSLEDGSYEGEDNGWIINTLDNNYEYGLIDYRKPQNILVLDVVN